MVQLLKLPLKLFFKVSFVIVELRGLSLKVALKLVSQALFFLLSRFHKLEVKVGVLGKTFTSFELAFLFLLALLKRNVEDVRLLINGLVRGCDFQIVRVAFEVAVAPFFANRLN